MGLESCMIVPKGQITQWVHNIMITQWVHFMSSPRIQYMSGPLVRAHICSDVQLVVVHSL